MRSALTVDADMERHYAQTCPDGHAAWWAWLTDVIGTDPGPKRIVRATLGEGYLIVERYEDPFRVVGDEIATIREVLPAPTPPPCWPAGCAIG